MAGLSYENYRKLLTKRSPNAGFNITINLQWNGSTVHSNMRTVLITGIKQAVTIYKTDLIRTLSRKWGSIPLGGTKRLRLWHSKPGQPPFIQTKNLVNSIKTAIYQKGNGWDMKLVGEIFTLVPYAQTLEYGGISARLAKKVYTHLRLINPINKLIRIAARPAWRPTFRRNVIRMFIALTKHGLGLRNL